MRKVLFLLVALMMSAAVKAQEIEKVDKFTSGYINGTYTPPTMFTRTVVV